jgi:hypothetical protein
MAFESIDTAPKDGNFVVLQDNDASAYEVARWSVEKGDWLRVTGEPVQIKPAHWMLLRTASSLPSSFDALGGKRRDRRRVGPFAGGLALVALALLYVPSVPNHFPGIAAAFRGGGGTENLTVETEAGGSGAQAQTRSGEQATEGKKRPRTESLFREVRSARAEIEALRVRNGSLSAALRQAQAGETERTYAHERQRLRADALASELESARAEIESLKTQVARTNSSASLSPGGQGENVEEKQAVEREQRQDEGRPSRPANPVAAEAATVNPRVEVAGKAEIHRAVMIANASADLTETPHEVPPLPPAKPKSSEANVAEKIASGKSGSRDLRGTGAVYNRFHGNEKAQIAFWVNRGAEFVRAGNFSSARPLLQRAANAGEGRAAFMLATTYDFRGDPADRAQAKVWYEKARALGSAEASKRLQLLEAGH